MPEQRWNAVYLGEGKDELNFPCQILEDPVTKARLVAYDVETWWQRCEYLTHLQSIGRQAPPPEAVISLKSQPA